MSSHQWMVTNVALTASNFNVCQYKVLSAASKCIEKDEVASL